MIQNVAGACAMDQHEERKRPKRKKAFLNSDHVISAWKFQPSVVIDTKCVDGPSDT